MAIIACLYQKTVIQAHEFSTLEFFEITLQYEFRKPFYILRGLESKSIFMKILCEQQ